MLTEQGFPSALANNCCVREFASKLLDLAGVLQVKLHQLSEVDKSFSGAGYGVLMEIYGLRTRAYTLLNDPSSHVVSSLDFSQSDLLSLFDGVSGVVRAVNSLKDANSIVVSVATLTVSLGGDRAKVVKFLFNTLSDDVAELEASPL